MYPATESGRSESGPFVIDDYIFMTVFIRRVPVEASEWIRTAAATYDYKFYNYMNTIRTCTDTIQTANETPRIPVHAA